jgi:phage gp29-like protein
LRTGQDGVGSYALAETQGGLFQQAIGAHLDTVANTINEQAIVPLMRMNGFSDALAPTLMHGDIESADLARLGTYLTNLASAGLLEPSPELSVFLHEIAGLPIASVEELQAQADEDAAMAAQIAAQTTDEDTDVDVDEETPQDPAQRATEGPLPPRTDVGQDDIDDAVALFRSLVSPEWRDVLDAGVE